MRASSLVVVVLALLVAACAGERDRPKRNPKDKAGDMKKFSPQQCSAKRGGAGGQQCARHRRTEGRAEPQGAPRPASLPVPEWTRGARERALARGRRIYETVEHVPVLPKLDVERVRRARRASVEAKRKRDAAKQQQQQ